jgi:Flp pilus assembly protein TadG
LIAAAPARARTAAARPARRASSGRESGQATVELALAFPIVAVMLLTLVQVTLVVRDQIAVVHAAREAARAAAVTHASAADGVVAARTATALDPSRLTVHVSTGANVTASVSYRSPTDVPLVGRMLGDVTLQATAVMRAEP